MAHRPRRRAVGREGADLPPPVRLGMAGLLARGTGLLRAGFGGADLTGTDFTGTDLRAAELQHCQRDSITWPVSSPSGLLVRSGTGSAPLATGLRLLDVLGPPTHPFISADVTWLADPLTGHGSSVTSCAFSADGSRIVYGGWDNTLRVWDAVKGAALETTKAERELLKRTGRVGGLEISAVGSLRLTNPTTGTFLREICPLNDGEWAVPGAPVLEAEAFGPLLTAALCPPPAALCPLPSARCPLPSARCPLPAARCPLPITFPQPNRPGVVHAPGHSASSLFARSGPWNHSDR